MYYKGSPRRGENQIMGTSTREEAGEDENEKSSGGGDGDS